MLLGYDKLIWTVLKPFAEMFMQPFPEKFHFLTTPILKASLFQYYCIKEWFLKKKILLLAGNSKEEEKLRRLSSREVACLV